MHNNFYFLRQLSPSLEAVLKEGVISECFSQNKDEIIIRAETHRGSFFIKASLLADFSCLSFPDDFSRARKNSVNLFAEAIGCRILSVRQFQNERSIALELAESKTILFKMHANRSNIILYDKGGIVDLFKKNLQADYSITLDSLDRTIDWSYEYFIHHEQSLKSAYFTFGKIVWNYLEEIGFAQFTAEKKWEQLQHLLGQLENPVFYLTQIHGIPQLSLIPTGNITREFRDPLQALNAFFSTYTQTIAFAREKNALLGILKSKQAGSEKYLAKTKGRLEEIREESYYKIWADVIMANLSTLKTGMEQIRLPNFYHNNDLIEIKLKKSLSPQKNAELYYKKGKNQRVEIEHLQKNIENKEKEINELTSALKDVQAINDFKALREKSNELTTRISIEKPDVTRPYHEFEHNGYKIWVGKNAASNDTLTLKYTFKDDLWLHVKDVAGSHVVIKFQAGKKIPKDVIERAAQLAAYNSKRKNESLCPVVVTPKKFVRKRKGDPPGAVVVEREEVIMVEPKQ